MSQPPPDPEPAASPAPREPLGALTPWTAGAAVVFCVLAIMLAVGTSGMLQPLHAPLGAWIGRHFARAPGQIEAASLAANTMLTLMVMQAVMAGMAWWGAARFGADRWRLLSLDRGFTLRDFLWGVLGMAAILIPYNLLTFWLLPSQFAADLRPMWDLARSPVSWLVFLAVAVGAPIAEELMFRGFLLPALTKTAGGFTGAAIASTIGWTALHFYSVAGLIEVFIVGLYFCWLMRRFGTLWLPLTLHALYNGVQFLALAWWPG